MRDHEPTTIEEFNGLWARGDYDSCPIDHSTEFINFKFSQSSFLTRDGVEQYINKQNIVRAYAYNIDTDGFLVLTTAHKIFHVVLDPASITEILDIVGMLDFKYLNVNNRAYITPFGSNKGGMQSEFVYVYKGDGTTARKAAGVQPKDADGALAAADGAAGTIELGYHIFGVVYLTDTGFFTQIGPDTLPALNAAGSKKADLTNVCVSPNSYVTKRYIVATKAINPSEYTGNTRGYEFFFVPSGVINDNTTTTITVDFYDDELVDSADYLLDILSEIPASNHLALYNNRMASINEFGHNGLIRFSESGQPEVFDSVSGLVQLPDNGLGLATGISYRGVFYTYRINQTVAISDNNDVPSSWLWNEIDEGIGSAMRGLGITGIYEGGVNIDYILNFDYNGLFLYSGTYNRPELTWKIRDYWVSLDRVELAYNFQCLNDPLSQRIYISTNSTVILVGDYANGLDWKNIRWSKWTFDETVASILLMEKDNRLVICTSSYIYYVKSGNTSDEWSSGTTKIPDPTFISALIPGQDPEEDLTHFGATKIRVTGTGTLRQKFYGFDNVLTQTLGNVTMSASPGQQPLMLANFINQRARLELKTTGIDEKMNVNRILVFTKPIFTSLPG